MLWPMIRRRLLWLYVWNWEILRATLLLPNTQHSGTFDEKLKLRFHFSSNRTPFFVRIESERSNYRIWISGYSGNATDSLSKHNGSGFSTYDNINDIAPKCCPCVNSFGGGWWFYRYVWCTFIFIILTFSTTWDFCSCFEANLNGEYFADPLDNNYYQGLIWEKWKGDYSLKSTKMMIRSVSFNMPLSE